MKWATALVASLLVVGALAQLEMPPPEAVTDPTGLDSVMFAGDVPANNSDSELTIQRGSRCSSLGKPGTVSYKTDRSVSSDMKASVESFFRQSRRYCDQARVVIFGDSIQRQLNDKRGCLSTIFRSFNGKGLNFGISGIKSDWEKAVADWLMKNTCLAPQVVFIAVGVNDCILDADRDTGVNAGKNIIDLIEVIKSYSPESQIVVQGTLPTSIPDQDPEGEKWDSDMKLFTCVESIKKTVSSYINRLGDNACVKYVNLDKVVLDDDEFRDVLDQGVHIKEDDMMPYCKAIGAALAPYRSNEVSTRGSITDWVDAEPFHFTGLEGEDTYFRWRYNEWSNCTGACGIQRRTAECHQIDVNSTMSPTVDEALCANVFMNPLERVCNVDEECLKSRTPESIAAIEPGMGKLVAAEPECDAMNNVSKALLGSTVALAVAFVTSLAAMAFIVVKQSRRAASAEEARSEAKLGTMEREGSARIAAVKV